MIKGAPQMLAYLDEKISMGILKSRSLIATRTLRRSTDYKIVLHGAPRHIWEKVLHPGMVQYVDVVDYHYPSPRVVAVNFNGKEW